ncbi:MAG: DUF4384 domain-containing protein [Smithellaceae bacterium]|nr:DUF4384 domain-containing protein [Smithellaceae bacterium]
MKRACLIIFLLPIFFTYVSGTGLAGEKPGQAGEIRKGIEAEGACAIVGMSAEQSQLTALQRARAAAIEQAAGVAVTSATLVTNYTVAADFIKTYARGFIIAEQVVWLPLEQYQKDASTPPIPEYRVRIIADVYVPRKKAPVLGLRASLNNRVFRNGEQARISLRANKDAGFAVFNIMADDRVALLFPNIHEPHNVLAAGKDLVLPAKDARVVLEMHTLPGHQKDAEAFLILAWDPSRDIRIREMFPAAEPSGFSEFFRKLAELADYAEEVILPYEVVTGR